MRKKVYELEIPKWYRWLLLVFAGIILLIWAFKWYVALIVALLAISICTWGYLLSVDILERWF